MEKKQKKRWMFWLVTLVIILIVVILLIFRREAPTRIQSSQDELTEVEALTEYLVGLEAPTDGCNTIYKTPEYPDFSFPYDRCQWLLGESTKYIVVNKGKESEFLQPDKHLVFAHRESGNTIDIEFHSSNYTTGYGRVNRYGYCSQNSFKTVNESLLREESYGRWSYQNYLGPLALPGTDSFPAEDSEFWDMMDLDSSEISGLTFCTSGGPSFLTDTTYTWETASRQREDLKTIISVAVYGLRLDEDSLREIDTMISIMKTDPDAPLED